MEIRGIYYFPKSSKFIKSKAIVKQNFLLIVDNEGKLIEKSEINEIIIDVSVQGIPNSIKFSSGALFSPADSSFRWKFSSNSSKISEKIRSKNITIIVSIFLLPIILWIGVSKLLPQLAEEITKTVPETLIVKISQNALSRVDKLTFQSSLIPDQDRSEIEALFNGAVKSVSSKNKYNLLFFNSEVIGANAYALPDGTLIITDDLINKLIDYPEAILAILLHEIGHVEKNHTMRLIIESLGVGIIFYYIVGDIPGLTEIITGSAFNLIQNSFSREMELEADEYSLKKLENLGIPKDAFIFAMQNLIDDDNLDNKGKIVRYLSTHPQVEERIEIAKKF